MIITKTKIPDLLIIEPKVFNDERGYFMESYNENIFKEHHIDVKFIQDNQSKSSYGVVRGLHYQTGVYTQTKLVRALQGAIFDVGVDLRKDSPTFGQWFGIELSDENKKQLLVPKGFAHGFSVLSETAVVFYKCDEFYNPQSEQGIKFDDPQLNINWGIESNKAIISEKDKNLPYLTNLDNKYLF